MLLLLLGYPLNPKKMQTTTRSYYSTLTSLDDRFANLDADKRLAAIAPSALPNPLPAANKGEYFYFNTEGTITLSLVDFLVNKGDWLWCNSDDTAQGDGSKWEVIALPEGRSPFWVDPVIGAIAVVADLPTGIQGDRYLIKDPIGIKKFKGRVWVDEEFPKGATVKDEAGTTWFNRGAELISDRPLPPEFQVVAGTVEIVTTLPTSAEVGDKYFSGGQIATWSQQSFDPDPETFGWEYLTPAENAKYLVGANSATHPNEVMEFATGGQLNFTAPESAGILFESNLNLFLEWEQINWTNRVYERIIASTDAKFYVDFANGSDINPGTQTKPFKSFETAIAKVSACYDFSKVAKIAFYIVDTAWAIGSVIKLPVFFGNPEVVIEPLTSCTVTPTANKLILFQSTARDQFYRLNGFVFDCPAVLNTRCILEIFASRGSIANNTFKGLIDYPISIRTDAIFFAGGNKIENLTCRELIIPIDDCRINYTGTWTAAGDNTATEGYIYAADSTNILIRSSGKFTLESGAVCRGKRFLLKDKSNLQIPGGRRTNFIFGSEPGQVATSAATDKSSNDKYYSHLVLGGKGAIASDLTKLQMPNTQVAIYNDSDRRSSYWDIVDLDAQTLNLPAINSGYLYVDINGYNFTANYPSPSLLHKRVYLGYFESDGTKFTSFSSLLIERSPDALDLLFSGGIRNNAIVPYGKTGTKNIVIPGGQIQVVGSNYFTNYLDPHKHLIAQQNPANWDLFDPDGNELGSDLTELDFSQYWDVDTVAAVTGNNACLRYLYYCPDRWGNKLVQVLGTFKYTSIGQAFRDFQGKEQHVKPDFLGTCILLSTIIGRVDFSDAGNRNQVGFISHLFSDRNSSAGVTVSDGFLRGVDPNNISGIDAEIYHTVYTTDKRTFKSFDGISWEED